MSDILSFLFKLILFIPLSQSFRSTLYYNSQIKSSNNLIYLKINDQDNPDDNLKRRIVSPDDVRSLFTNNKEIGPTGEILKSDDKDYDYDDYIEYDDEEASASTSASTNDDAGLKEVVISKDDVKTETVNEIPNTTATQSKKENVVVDQSILDLVKLENQYNEARLVYIILYWPYILFFFTVKIFYMHPYFYNNNNNNN